MADKKAAANTKSDPAPSKGGGKLRTITIMIIVGLMSPFIMPTIILLLIGMMPTFVAMITDEDRQKSTAIAIGSLNFAGVIPFIIDLWIKGQSWPTAIHIMKEPANWFVMLGAAAIGQLVVFAIPPLLTSLTMARLEGRHKMLKHNLDSLKTTWGNEVSTTTPLSKLTNKD